MNRTLYTKSVTLDNINWTPVAVSQVCTSVTLTNDGDDLISLRTDPDDSTTQSKLFSGSSKTYDGAAFPNIPLVYAKTSSSTGPIIVDAIVKDAV